jgi:hypothetical protein
MGSFPARPPLLPYFPPAETYARIYLIVPATGPLYALRACWALAYVGLSDHGLPHELCFFDGFDHGNAGNTTCPRLFALEVGKLGLSDFLDVKTPSRLRSL